MSPLLKLRKKSSGIVGMEGNGPIQGTPKPVGVLIFGDGTVAVDPTYARVARLNPESVDYLMKASAFLGKAGGEAYSSPERSPVSIAPAI